MMEKRVGQINEYIFAFIIISSCIFLQYHFLVISYGMVFVFCALLFRLIIRKKILVYDKDFLQLTLVLCIQQVISALFLDYGRSHLLTNCIFILFVFVISGTSKSVGKKNVLVDCIIVVSTICTLAILVQAFQIYVLGRNVSAIALLPLTEEIAASWNNSVLRPCGFFSEPQTYSSYMAPLLFILIHDRKYKSAIFLSIGMILCGSSLGISITFIAWFYLILSREMSRTKKVLLILLGLLFVIVFMNVEVLFEVRGKIEDVFKSFNSYSVGNMVGIYSYSNYLRVVKGWVTLIEMPFFDKLIGIGKDSFGVYLENKKFSFSWNNIWGINQVKSLYYSSAAGVFIEYGLFTGIIYYFFFIRKAVQNHSVGRRIILLLLFECFFTQISYNGLFVYYILMFYLFSEVNNPILFSFGSKK